MTFHGSRVNIRKFKLSLSIHTVSVIILDEDEPALEYASRMISKHIKNMNNQDEQK